MQKWGLTLKQVLSLCRTRLSMQTEMWWSCERRPEQRLPRPRQSSRDPRERVRLML